MNHVNSTSDDAGSSDKTTLVVAPVADTTESDRQYGDYASHDITWDGNSSDEDAQDYAQSAKRLVSALQLAQNEGMKVVLVSNTLQGFTPDVYAPMTTPSKSANCRPSSWSASLNSTKPAPTIRSISKCYSPTMPPMKAVTR